MAQYLKAIIFISTEKTGKIVCDTLFTKKNHDTEVNGPKRYKLGNKLLIKYPIRVL